MQSMIKGSSNMLNEHLLLERLNRIEESLQILLQQRVVQASYSTAAAARVLGDRKSVV